MNKKGARPLNGVPLMRTYFFPQAKRNSVKPEEELRKAEPEEELRLNEVPYCILTKSLFLVPLNLFLGAFKQVLKTDGTWLKYNKGLRFRATPYGILLTLRNSV